MSFAAMATWQALLVMAAVIAAAVYLFLMKIRPPQIRVPSLTLWTRVLDEVREQSWWERYRKVISLIVAILITAALLFAVLRPQRSITDARAGSAAARAGRTSIVIDSSWSMLAETSNGQTRWDRAVSRARALAIGAAGEDIVLSTTADGVVEGPTPDVALIEAALDRITPSGGDATAFPRVEGAQQTHFLTDGAVPRALEADVVVESVFEAADNVAITAFDVRPASATDSAGQAFLEVANYSKTQQDVHITLVRGNASLLDVHADLAAGAAVQRMVPLDRVGDARIRARVSAKSNSLVIDDEAVAVIDGVQPINVIVVSEQAANLGPIITETPGVNATFVRPVNYKPGNENLVIFDRALPSQAPTAPALFIAPPGAPHIRSASGTTSPTGAQGRGEEHPQWLSGGWHPILQGVDVQTMALDRARPYTPDGMTAVAVSATNAPLVYVRDTSEQRFALFTFSVTESKLMFAPGFPVLMGNAIEWLSHAAPSGVRHPGRVTFPGTIVSLVGPDGKEVPMTVVDGASIATLATPGFYQATSAGATRVIPVNAGDPDTSDLQRTRLPEATQANSDAGTGRGRPWWLIAGMFAFFLLAAEWWTWQRRVTV